MLRLHNNSENLRLRLVSAATPNVVEACARKDYLDGAYNHMKDHSHSPQTPQRPATTRNRPAHQ